LAGGFLFGIGFITAGLCPGTSCVALATGKMDGLVVLVGIFFGIFLFGETFDYFYDFMYSTSLGQVTLPQFFHISHGVVVLFVVLAAISGFFGAGVVERRFSPSNGECCTNQSIKKPELKVEKILGITALLLGVMAAVSGNPVRNGQIDAGLAYPDSIHGRQIAYLGPVQLAELFMARRQDMTILDLRSETDFETYHIPSAQQVVLSDVASHKIPNDKTIILYAGDGQCAAEAWSEITEQGFENVFVLQGGLERWFDEILFPDLTVTRGLNKTVIEKIKRRSRYFGGTPRQNDIGRSGSRRRYLREGC
jgi:rhodanese-related sulfurtransferase